jgi:hypothetical protein
MVGAVTPFRSDFWYLPNVVRRRISLVTTLSLALLVPAPVAAQAEPVVSASPAPASSTAPSAFPADTGLLPIPWATAWLTPTATVAPEPAQAVAEPRSTPRPAKLPKPDFRIGKWKLQRLKWRELPLNSGEEVPIVTSAPTDRRGIPMRPLGPGGSLVYNPTVLAQQGMKRLDSYKVSGKKVHLRQARKFVDKLRDLAEGGRQRRWQPHPYPYRKFESGWVNANSHGLVLSFLSRYYRITGNKQRLREGARLLAAYKQRPENERWFADTNQKRYLWFEHWPDGRHRHTLNAHINAMFGLYDYWHATGSPLAAQLFLGGARTVRDKLKLFRRPGDLSRYSLGLDQGTLHYHETHIDQLRTLSRMTGDPWFAKQADKFVKDENAWKDKYRRAAPLGGR